MVIRLKFYNYLINYFFVLILHGFLLCSVTNAFETYAKSSVVIDDLTETVILNKNGSDKIPPASMSKLMTLYMIFDALRDKRLSLTDMIKVSKNASSKGGSKMFLHEGQLVSIEDIIRGIIIHSGNDACIAIAEALSGTEKEFAKDMTIKGSKIGLKNSIFTNSTGWPDENHFMTAEDLVFLAKLLIEEFPNYYSYFKENDFTWNNIYQKNRNPLLNRGLGADGLKTGHTEEAGYGLVGSAIRGNRRVTFIISGLNTKKERAREAEKILSWAFRDFTATKIVSKEQVLGHIPTWLGAKKTVPVTSHKDVYLLLPDTLNNVIETYIEVASPIKAPFESGTIAPAKLLVKYNSKNEEEVVKKYTLITQEGSLEGNFLTRFKAATIILLDNVKKLVF